MPLKIQSTQPVLYQYDRALDKARVKMLTQHMLDIKEAFFYEQRHIVMKYRFLEILLSIF